MNKELNIQTILADVVGDGHLRRVTLDSHSQIGYQVESRNLRQEEIEQLAHDHYLTIVGQLLTGKRDLFEKIDFTFYPSLQQDRYQLEKPVNNMSKVLQQLDAIHDYLQTAIEVEGVLPLGPVLLILTESGSRYF